MAPKSKTQTDLQELVHRLQKENDDLQATCANLQSSQSILEQLIGENNASLLKADMARMELEQIFSAYTDAIWVVREDGVVVRANTSMLQMLGKNEEEVLGHKCSELLQTELCSAKSCPPCHLNDRTTREFDIELESNGRQRHYLLTTAPLVTLDGTPGIAAQFKDITSRKEAEIALAEANLALGKMAHIDGLTQIPNRRSFDQTLQREWQRLRRAQKPLSLLLADIDFFKKYNDHYGHQAGDDCLRQVGQALSGAGMRSIDLAARYGGEEFVLLLPEVDPTGALTIGRRALKAIGDLKIPHAESEARDTVSISMGAATLTPDWTGNPEDLIALADAALYRAKEEGRNRVVTAEGESTRQ